MSGLCSIEVKPFQSCTFTTTLSSSSSSSSSLIGSSSSPFSCLEYLKKSEIVSRCSELAKLALKLKVAESSEKDEKEIKDNPIDIVLEDISSNVDRVVMKFIMRMFIPIDDLHHWIGERKLSKILQNYFDISSLEIDSPDSQKILNLLKRTPHFFQICLKLEKIFNSILVKDTGYLSFIRQNKQLLSLNIDYVNLTNVFFRILSIAEKELSSADDGAPIMAGESEFFVTNKDEDFKIFSISDNSKSSILGKGSWGIVRKAFCWQTGGHVAIKTAIVSGNTGDAESQEYLRNASIGQLENEITVLRRFKKQGIEGAPTILGVFSDFMPSFAMTCLQMSARQWMLDPVYSPRERLELCQRITKLVLEVTAAGVLLIDLKPNNMLLDLTPEGSIVTVNLCDLALATFEDDDTNHVLQYTHHFVCRGDVEEALRFPKEKAKDRKNYIHNFMNVYAVAVICFNIMACGHYPRDLLKIERDNPLFNKLIDYSLPETSFKRSLLEVRGCPKDLMLLLENATTRPAVIHTYEEFAKAMRAITILAPK